jgi:hypothetical protein
MPASAPCVVVVLLPPSRHGLKGVLVATGAAGAVLSFPLALLVLADTGLEERGIE